MSSSVFLSAEHRLPLPRLEIQIGLHIPSKSSNCKVFGEAQEVLKHSHEGNSILELLLLQLSVENSIPLVVTLDCIHILFIPFCLCIL